MRGFKMQTAPGAPKSKIQFNGVGGLRTYVSLTAYAVTSVPIDLIETDLFGLGRGREKRYRARHEGKPQKTFPIGTRGHRQYSKLN